jgi:hypothetical protein
VAAVNGELPLEPKIPFVTRVRVARDHRNEQRAALDLLADRRIPGIATAKFTLIEPDLNASRTQRVAELLGSLGVLGGVAKEHSVAEVGHDAFVTRGLKKSCGSAASAIHGLIVIVPVAYLKSRVAALGQFRLRCFGGVGKTPCLLNDSRGKPHLFQQLNRILGCGDPWVHPVVKDLWQLRILDKVEREKGGSQ